MMQVSAIYLMLHFVLAALELWSCTLGAQRWTKTI